jgi:crotonobetainyl-CoA:carnitine CoA-transferase CaiB-like acyl-CoA transferase
MPTPLFGDLLVIDCASFIAGPAAATIMSDFGARVIKIEDPARGDTYRDLIRLRDPTGETIDYFWTLDSRNKESLALDLKSAAGRDVLRRLVERADVFITNFPFPARERLGLRAEDLTALNERLIYASMTPYGETGPERDRKAYDTTAWWARSGLMRMVRDTGDTPLGASVPGMGDHPTAVSMYAAILTALYRRQITGRGGVVSTSLLANGLWSNSCQVQAALCDVELTMRGPRGARTALNETYACADGHLVQLGVGNAAREWPLFALALGHPEWLDDPRFATQPDRLRNAAALTALIEQIFATRPWRDWLPHLEAAGVTFGLVADIADHPGDEQLDANGLLPDFVDGLGLKTVDSPFQLQGETKQDPRMAPSLGQHSRAILEEFGCSPQEVAAILGDTGG